MIVQVEEGLLRGTKHRSLLTGRTFEGFLGIPYAKPPVGDLRFRAPVPSEKWNGIRDATGEGDSCFQANPSSTEYKTIGSEDCLYLNVFRPETEIQGKKAVMVYIHGGGFSAKSGSSAFCGPDYLIDHDIILVTINYRLHVFGFLNTGTPSCPGNAGLKDQLLAMKWIKRNIASFGGDSDNITLFGESAGAVSVHLHMLSPSSKGLFHKAIIQSGSALCPWALDGEPEAHAREIGRLAGYDKDDLEGLVQYLKNLPGRELCELAEQCFKNNRLNKPGRCSTLVFYPSIEKLEDGAFLPDYPEKLIETSAPIPTIVGFADQEGLLFFIAQARESLDLLLNDISVAVENNFQIDPSQRADLVEKIKTFYFKNKPITRASLPEFINMYTDWYFMKFYEAFNYLIESDIPPHVYLFACDGQLNLTKKALAENNDFNIPGAAHGDDVHYLFKQSMVPIELGEVERTVIDSICTLWTNFAKTGRPASSLPIDWEPHTRASPSYLRIGEELNVFNEKLFEERFGFWKNWLKDFRR